MTNAEIVATWMEPKPDPCPIDTRKSRHGWWIAKGIKKIGGLGWRPASLPLPRLWLVEARLTVRQCCIYDGLLMEAVSMQSCTFPGSYPWHATAEQKLAALAEVLRAEVEGA